MTIEDIAEALGELIEEAGLAAGMIIMCDDPMTMPITAGFNLNTTDARELMCRAIVRTYNVKLDSKAIN
jgi:hypothetical protein